MHMQCAYDLFRRFKMKDDHNSAYKLYSYTRVHTQKVKSCSLQQQLENNNNARRRQLKFVLEYTHVVLRDSSCGVVVVVVSFLYFLGHIDVFVIFLR